MLDSIAHMGNTLLELAMIDSRSRATGKGGVEKHAR